MTPDEIERMRHLCELIEREDDARKFLELVEELNNLLERKQKRMEQEGEDS